MGLPSESLEEALRLVAKSSSCPQQRSLFWRLAPGHPRRRHSLRVCVLSPGVWFARRPAPESLRQTKMALVARNKVVLPPPRWVALPTHRSMQQEPPGPLIDPMAVLFLQRRRHRNFRRQHVLQESSLTQRRQRSANRCSTSVRSGPCGKRSRSRRI